MKKSIIKLFIIIIVCFVTAPQLLGQIKYQEGRLIYGSGSTFGDYAITIRGNGIYFDHTRGRFLQLSVMPTGAPRIAGHNNQIVFYNTQKSVFNDIQVARVLNYSDARAKTNIQSFTNGIDLIKKLRPVSYNFQGNQKRLAPMNKFTGSNVEIGLLAQELEQVMPNLVYTDDEGKKLVDYVSLIPVLINAIQTLQKEVDELKNENKFIK